MDIIINSIGQQCCYIRFLMQWACSCWWLPIWLHVRISISVTSIGQLAAGIAFPTRLLGTFDSTPSWYAVVVEAVIASPLWSCLLRLAIATHIPTTYILRFLSCVHHHHHLWLQRACILMKLKPVQYNVPCLISCGSQFIGKWSTFMSPAWPWILSWSRLKTDITISSVKAWRKA